MKSLALSALPTLIFLAILALTVTIWIRYPLIPPVHLQLDGSSPYVVCPGEKIFARVRISVRKPSMLRFRSSVVGEDEYNIAATQDESSVFLFSRKTSYYEYFSRNAPDIDAGTYKLIVVAVADNEPERPSFLAIPFQIGENCDARN